MRRDGKTTRTIDQAIQTLFEFGEITVPGNVKNQRYYQGKDKRTIVVDPDASLGTEVQRDLFSRIRKRLRHEHPDIFEMSPYDMTIRIKKYLDGES